MENKVQSISDDIIKDAKKIQQEDNILDESIKVSSSNLKELEQLYKKNYLLKQQIDREKRLLKRARENFELEISRKYREFNQYKDDMSSIIEKNKKDISNERKQLAKEQEELDRSKKAFETSKKKQQLNFKLKKEKQVTLLNSKKNQLEAIELNLKLKKEKIESLRRTLEYDMLEFEGKKRELNNNLERFNSLVNNIGNSMDKLREKNEVSDEKN